jgi:hypothetical protein
VDSLTCPSVSCAVVSAAWVPVRRSRAACGSTIRRSPPNRGHVGQSRSGSAAARGCSRDGPASPTVERSIAPKPVVTRPEVVAATEQALDERGRTWRASQDDHAVPSPVARKVQGLGRSRHSIIALASSPVPLSAEDLASAAGNVSAGLPSICRV